MGEAEPDPKKERRGEPTPEPTSSPERDDVRAKAGPTRCPFCHERVDARRERWLVCADCLARHHRACWKESGRCAACASERFARAAPATRARADGAPKAAVALVSAAALLLLAGAGLLFSSRGDAGGAHGRGAGQDGSAPETPARELGERDPAVAVELEPPEAKEELDPAVLVATAREAHAAGNLGQAEELLSRALELSPDYAPAWLERGAARAARQDMARAAADLERAVALDDGLLRGHLLLAAVRATGGDDRAALLHYDRVIELDPAQADAIHDRGTARNRLGDAPGAIADFERFLELRPEHARAEILHRIVAEHYFGRGVEAIGRSQAGAAAEAFTQALVHTPDDADAYYNRGNARAMQGNNKAALADFDRAIELQPEHPLAFVSRGAVRLRVEQPEGAAADFDRAIEVNPREPDGYANRAALRDDMGDTAGALADFKSALERLRPGDPRDSQFRRAIEALSARLEEPETEETRFRKAAAELNSAVLHSRGGRMKEALEAVERALELSPKLGVAYFHRGKYRSKMGDSAAALPDFDRALELGGPGLVRVHLARGQARKDVGDLEGALADFDESIRRQEDPAGSHTLRAITLEGMGRNADAEEACEDALRIDPTFAPARGMRGLLRLERGALEEAEADFAWILERHPGHPDTLLGRGRIRLAQGRAAEAVADLEQALAGFPLGVPERKEAEKVLAEARRAVESGRR